MNVDLAADWARYQLQSDIFMSAVPSAAGRPMVPALLKALYKRHLSRYAIQHLQVISGKSFGYHPETFWWDQKKVFRKWKTASSVWPAIPLCFMEVLRIPGCLENL